ncbi:NAD(P)/FAD-dependent oxidoreductase [Acinetobacter gerneri]|uniref:NAD(P)/FAD-dependent oxidoreductase n=1 Tax=Acinetobacter gerneri TaxID=202952 RepID=A0AAW8JE92_9GAMM|nr:NAD(P)/FAD-dependent oxidoreductase [Acinetobacter gerneri]MDQ9008732.1 NAD(P)/FAD-dependent oxidoreductase [Acinetobacter gerneri]MDQ9012720.1 NAD(P)/FAD-dependent oxidoreductase [Acinetobacter gerneri]MDQ9024271.1 NAD(P)/FAD-dependent oxidoreductase [Acinetobacter gerneri]MDQ9051508.1 NAD(P)/FAD-dependent oxidoreductase [Acinetobacter gerneri]MDQ9058731.1 NAD(P)/FAD-dependent oxidoreductase [Acinetobacter gerneri]
MMNETVLDLNPQDLTENQSKNGVASQDTEQTTTESKKAATKTSTTSKRQAATKKAAPVHVYDTIIVGAGISGLAAAYQLNQVSYDNYIVLEKAARVGGTWRDNNYPGCGCDVPSALYSFSFSPSHKWSHLFAKQPEILSYLEDVAEKYNLNEKIEFENELLSAKWDEKKHLWNLETSKGPYQAKTVIFTTGPITEPSMPKLKGIETFKGEMFHSARWNHDYDLTGKRVAVIGTGASAIQFIPQVQPLAKELIVFQRTAPWVLPKADMPLSDTAKGVISRFPIIQETWRKSIAQILNGINFGLRNPKVLEPVNFLSKKLLKLQIKDDQLRKDVTPNFSIGCKRLLFANNYYPALQQDNVSLLPHGLVEIEGNTVVAANGERHEVDVIIWGTGFEVSHPPIGKRVSNANGQLLSDLWKNSSPEAYLGTSLENVPNAFLVLGPNILVYDSFIGIAEAQVNYIVNGLLKMRDYKFTRFEIKKDVIRKHNEKVQKQLQTTVFNAGGCKSYYLDENGRNFAAWPWSLKKLKQELSEMNLKHYHTEN